MGLNFTDFSIEMARGDDETLEGVVYQADGETPENITGWEVWFTAKLALTENDPGVFQKTVGDGITLDDPTHGAYTVAIDAADTDSFAATDVTLLCDVQVKDGAGKVKTHLTGKITVKPEVTRSTS